MLFSAQEANQLDKITLKFLADVLYIKGVICSEELEDILEVKTINDLDIIIDKMLDDAYILKRGETYGYGNVVGKEDTE